ncbi:hypothetical protein [Diaphorobacter sp.]|uniref:hypothetical protein n=1 Tax=Diaphorobacter sp. TaxID=1934310 RepID=UPI0025889F68|nr:hypothetical protein [Diaphorobacter sp.]
MARSKSTTESAQFKAQAKKALAGKATGGEDIQAAPGAPTPDEICRVVEHCFGEDPETVLAPLERGVEVLQWLEAICHCIGTTLATEDVSSAIPLAKSLADCGKWLAGDQANGYLEPEFDNMMSKVATAMHEKEPQA